MTSDASEYASGRQIHVVLDEAFDPATAVVATVFTQEEFDAANSRVGALTVQYAESGNLAGLASFDEFLKKGLHATGDPFEIYVDFVTELFRTLPGKTFVYFSDGVRRHDLSPKKTVLLLYLSLLQVIFKKYRHSHTIHLHFEDHEELGPYFERLSDAAKAGSKTRSVVTVKRCKKGDPPALAIADYLLHVFGRARDYVLVENLPPEEAAVRNWQAIKSHFSLIYSMETHLVLNRQGLVVSSLPSGDGVQ